ncbi:F0F1 ATP synthase subunit A [Dactylosporangium sp. AC04546]|uniref:F0F1 ATP synthase subunit A n=1 Tax=Dactylosporangium sp. AC04546 TaxID=2862460 RepID=UPI001EDE1D5E|nr:F0F1 ATP synthase subunit A [Dactylosporangium sp. AC04546]WVK85061.1 F0F1 ATP synthase subunit A [Dactylosporangium sp. AC04546]
MSGLILAEVPFPPTVGDIFPPNIGDIGPWLSKFTLLILLAVTIVLVYFLVSYRNPQVVPTKKQWLAESIYGFVREGVAKDVIGHQGLRFAPYLASLFTFILVANVFAIVPGIQISPMSHIAFPAVLALCTYGLYLYQGFKKHGFFGYLKHATYLPAPWYMQPLLLPIEALQAFILQPATLALRLFANMFAGHMLLLVFTLGGFALLNAESIFIKPISVLSWGMTILLTFFELLVAALQAYVFTLLTANYLAGTLAEEH